MGRRALCVGVNKFKNLPDAALQGCVNDAANMKSLLTTYMGFTDKDVTSLTDAKATKVNIMKALQEMVDGAKAGKYSYLVFSLSSHGTQVPDKDGDEDDKADEAFCPHDLIAKGDQWDPAHVITDDELRNLFLQLPESTLLEAYLDTCHSGTGLRGIDLMLTRKPRFLPPPTAKGFEKVDGKRSVSLNRSLLEKGMVHHVLWAGCRSDQTSADAQIAGGWHGAFTYYFSKHMNATKNKVSRAEILKRVRADLKKENYTQIPQLESPATQKKLSPTPE